MLILTGLHPKFCNCASCSVGARLKARRLTSAVLGRPRTQRFVFSFGFEFGLGSTFGGPSGAVDGNYTFEVGALLDHDMGGGEIAGDGSMLFDFNSIIHTKAALDGAINDYFPGQGLGVYVGSFSDGQAMPRNGK